MTAKSLPKPVLLISDLHLEEDRPDLTQAFLAFIAEHAHGASALYILGDLFNVWIGDDDDRPLKATVCKALTELASQGIAIYLMHGNRDFLLGADFAKAAGATLLAEPHLLQIRGKHYLLLHGDSLCTRDEGYQAFRAQVRDPRWQADFLAKPLSERRAFAEQARTASKSMNSNKAADIMDVTPYEVSALLQQYQVGTMIHGHTHRPARHTLLVNGWPCERLVLSDWDNPTAQKFIAL